MRRLAGRHGKIDGANAWTNFAFFDGHVASFPTKQFNQDPAGSAFPQNQFRSETIFWLGHEN